LGGFKRIFSGLTATFLIDLLRIGPAFGGTGRVEERQRWKNGNPKNLQLSA